MAHHKSAIKRIRTNAQRRDRNRHFRSTVRTAVKKFQRILDEGNVEAARAAFPELMSQLDHSVVKGVVTKAAASRKISRMAKAIDKIGVEA